MRNLCRAAAVLSLTALGLAAAPVQAGDFALALEGGYYDMTNARDSATALFGSSGGPTFGGFVRYGLGRSLFVGAGARLFQRSGTRAFAAGPNSPAFSLGHPLDVRVIPAYALLGYRFMPDSRLSPYIAIGPGFTSYREESTVAGLSFDTSNSKVSGHAALGLEFGTGKIRAGLEAMYTTVPNIIGEDGISQVYEENDVGGVSLAARLVFVP